MLMTTRNCTNGSLHFISISWIPGKDAFRYWNGTITLQKPWNIFQTIVQVWSFVIYTYFKNYFRLLIFENGNKRLSLRMRSKYPSIYKFYKSEFHNSIFKVQQAMEGLIQLVHRRWTKEIISFQSFYG